MSISTGRYTEKPTRAVRIFLLALVLVFSLGTVAESFGLSQKYKVYKMGFHITTSVGFGSQDLVKSPPLLMINARQLDLLRTTLRKDRQSGAFHEGTTRLVVTDSTDRVVLVVAPFDSEVREEEHDYRTSDAAVQKVDRMTNDWWIGTAEPLASGEEE